MKMAVFSTVPVVLSEQSELKDHGSIIIAAVEAVRRFFDFALLTSLRMTKLRYSSIV